MKYLIASLLLLAGGCQQGPDGQRAQTATSATADPSTAVTSRSDNDDRVTVMNDSSLRQVVWEHRSSGKWTTYWKSLDIYGAEPTLRLADMNKDGRVDLFWSIAFEEIVGGSVVFYSPSGPVAVPIPIDECAQPQLTSDSLGYLVIAQGAGVVAADQCNEMDAEICANDAFSTWPRYFRPVANSLVEEPGSKNKYTALANEFDKSAQMVDSIYHAESTGAKKDARLEEICGREFPQRLRALADSARNVAS
jgi:hypothetical protein